MAAPQSGDVPFSGTVASNCTVIISSDGTLAANTNATVLGSTVSGGNPGIAQVVTNDETFSLSVADPTDFSGPSGWNGTPIFTTEFDLTGATSGSGSSASAAALAAGATDVSVDLTATLASGVFASGDYSATVVLTCE